jgi:hypothetical protein
LSATSGNSIRTGINAAPRDIAPEGSALCAVGAVILEAAMSHYILELIVRDSMPCGVLRDNEERDNPAKERKAMKNFNKIAIAAAFAAMFSLVNQATAGDGIAASPRLRQFLNERSHSASTPSAAPAQVQVQEAAPAQTEAAAPVETPAAGQSGIAASPRLRQILNERGTGAGTPSTSVASAGYRATGADGIAASPRLRQQLNERGTQPIMVAPLK